MAINSPFEYWQSPSDSPFLGSENKRPSATGTNLPFGSSGMNPTFASFLEDEPRAAFFAGVPRGMTMGADTARRAARDIYPQALSEFYGALGEQIMRGNQPTLKFTDFLKENPYTERMAALGRQYGGMRQQQFRPRTRRLYF
tara:strand:- start:402 stop:827 length:426 start_codon:yes stop_codon:yes gene_type:complete